MSSPDREPDRCCRGADDLCAEAPRVGHLCQDAPDAILLADAETGIIFDVNPAAERLLMRPREQIVGAHCREMHPARFRHSAEEAFRRTLTQGKPQRFELVFLRSDGTEVPVDVAADTICRGGKTAVIGLFRDASARKQAENLLRVQHDLAVDLGSIRDMVPALDRILDAAMKVDGIDSGGVYLVDPESGALVLVSHRGLPRWFVEATGYLDAETSQARLVAASMQGHGRIFDVDPAFDDTCRKEGIQALAAIPIQGNGRTIAVMNIASHVLKTLPEQSRQALESIAGQIAGVIARVRAESALRDSEERFRRAFEEAPFGMVLGSTEGENLWVNHAMCEMLGYTEEELRATPLGELTHPDDRPATFANLRKLAAGEISNYTYEKRYLRKDGQVIWGRASATVVRDAEGNLLNVVAMIEDITEQKQAKEQIEKEQQLLARLLELHEQDRKVTAYEIHDGLAQHLAGAKYSLEAFQSSVDPQSDEAQQFFQHGLHMLETGLNEARRLISGLRPLILDEFGVVSAVDYLICETPRPAGLKIEFSHNIETARLAPPLENAVFRVVQAALSNVCQHSQSEKVRIELTRHDDNITVEVRDWGIGFDPKQVEGDRFGLRGIRERARLLGGSATIESVPGEGTCVRVELPLVPAAAESPDDSSPADE